MVKAFTEFEKAEKVSEELSDHAVG